MEKEFSNPDSVQETAPGENSPANIPVDQDEGQVHEDEEEGEGEGTQETPLEPYQEADSDDVDNDVNLEGFAIGRRRKQDDERLSIPDVLPVLPLKETVIYPFAMQPLGVGQ